MGLRSKFAVRRNDRERVEGCVEHVCRPDMRHGACCGCGRLTDGSTIVIDAKTLKRKKAMQCIHCMLSDRSHAERQARLREKRTERDWALLSDPVQTGTIRAEVMPEQYAGKARSAVRAFVASGALTAVVPDLDAASLTNTIGSLGLHGQVYAETRDDQTVLRRVSEPA